jgi:hypothetical protein
MTSIWGEGAEIFKFERGEAGTAGGRSNSNCNFMTFLHSPRSYIGVAFTRTEFKCILTALISIPLPPKICV